MMSVVAPICAPAGAANARIKKSPTSRAPNAFEILPVSKVSPGFLGSHDAVLDGGHSRGLRATATTVIRLPTVVCADALLRPATVNGGFVRVTSQQRPCLPSWQIPAGTA